MSARMRPSSWAWSASARARTKALYVSVNVSNMTTTMIAAVKSGSCLARDHRAQGHHVRGVVTFRFEEAREEKCPTGSEESAHGEDEAKAP